MKYLVDEMEGDALDCAVGLALHMPLRTSMGEARKHGCYQVPFDTGPSETDAGDDFEPSSVWNHGGPLIERERIVIAWERGRVWASVYSPGERVRRSFGPTPLIAAMRAFVKSKFGPEVELP